MINSEITSSLASGCFLNIDKPVGITSFDVIFKMRKLLAEKSLGHAGTLDPFATGVLPVAVKKGTKLIQYLVDSDKEYIADVRFGARSSSYDLTGELTNVLDDRQLRDFVINISDLEELLADFVGEKEQLPPKVSALKINGKRAYELARTGVDFELKPRLVQLKSVQILSFVWPDLRIRVNCGKGFYVRSLANDLGERLGVGAYLTALRRTRVGCFRVENAISLSGLAEVVDEVEAGKLSNFVDQSYFMNLTDFWREINQKVILLDEHLFAELKFGRFIDNLQLPDLVEGEICGAILNGKLVCLVLALPGAKLKMKLML
jgi:tRNA pseudouridine55 synthase